MCPPSRPGPDHYDHNPQVKPQFAQTPCLTPIPRGHRYNIAPGNSVADAVKSDIAKLYLKHNLKPCPHHGLYWAGLKKDTENKDRDLTMVLVIALIHTELHRWRELDDQARKILTKYELDGNHGVCYRFYEHRRNPLVMSAERESDLDQATWTPLRRRSSRQATANTTRYTERHRTTAREARSLLPPRRVNGVLFSGPVAEALTMPHPALRETRGGLQVPRGDASPVLGAARPDEWSDDVVDFGVGEVLDYWGPSD